MNEHATQQPATVTVLGLGAMGRAIAATLVGAGHSVTLWNRTAGRDGDLAKQGAVPEADLTRAVEASDLVLVCVLDSAAVLEVLDAVGDAVRGRTTVNLATGTPDEARVVADRVEQRGGFALDGVMMAVPAMIGTPEATILYGGSRNAHEQHTSTLLTMAGRSPFLGEDVGLPALYDVALLTMLYTTLTGWLQAFAVVGAGGVTAKEFLPHATSWFDNVVVADDPAAIADAVDRREYPDTVPSSLALNAAALRLLRDVQREIGVDSTVIEAISALADQGVAAGHGNDGFTSLIESLRSPRSPAEVAA
jgi:3-hydroxyisobutyrate dehydrogenase-like beta-hydroxyacid dehydrogenase